MRGLIADILESGGVEVVGEAGDGREALSVVAEVDPDVVTMDVEMPEMNGIEAVERLMAENPTPTLMLSAYTAEGAEETFAALDAGAVDFFAKPGGEVSMGVSRMEEQLVETVRSVAGADLSTAGRRRRSDAAAAAASAGGATPASTSASDPASPSGGATGADIEPNTTLIIGSSTGGPDAVERVVSALPGEADLRGVVVQHMPEAFTGRFATRLDDACELSVREAEDGMRLGRGELAVAKGGHHLEITNARNGRLRLTVIDEERGEGVRPSVNVTMRSAADVVDDPLIGVILTGMGGDGSDGVQALSRIGARVLAQDEESCVVYGMPKRAAATGAVDSVLPLGDIAAGITGEHS
ncbi:two-component system, chemotaxis family, response regulator CheB [Halobaculum gomorrense]|uniref:Protein-glutamate methylesterase/protein-glutamine glutaminase n=2 Tax=Halobaculum gomorrense TaxID=43928 RepID=A0A1M5QBN5_9EURY|nr:two-component system, chemotaxis family, response regulator CheB [Halobaculum gomorrense]